MANISDDWGSGKRTRRHEDAATRYADERASVMVNTATINMRPRLSQKRAQIRKPSTPDAISSFFTFGARANGFPPSVDRDAVFIPVIDVGKSNKPCSRK